MKLKSKARLQAAAPTDKVRAAAEKFAKTHAAVIDAAQDGSVKSTKAYEAAADAVCKQFVTSDYGMDDVRSDFDAYLQEYLE